MQTNIRFNVDVTINDDDSCHTAEIMTRLILDDAITRLKQHPQVDSATMKKAVGLFGHE